MLHEFKEIDHGKTPEFVKMLSNNLLHRVRTENDIKEQIRRVVDDVVDELITKAADAAYNQDVGAGDIHLTNKNDKRFIENIQQRQCVEDWIKSQAESHKLYQNSKIKETHPLNHISRNYTITRGHNNNNELFVSWELNHPTYAMVKVVKIGPKDRIIYSNGVLDSEEVKRIVDKSNDILNKKKGFFSRIRKVLRRMWSCVA